MKAKLCKWLNMCLTMCMMTRKEHWDAQLFGPWHRLRLKQFRVESTNDVLWETYHQAICSVCFTKLIVAWICHWAIKAGA